MKNRTTGFRIRQALLIAAASVAAFPALAQNAPLAFETGGPIGDERGQPLPGSRAGGALIEVFAAPGGVYPPGVDGEPHPSNAVVAVTHIGAGTDSSLADAGVASGALVLDRTKATRMFARVYNRETRAASSFYGDSAIYTNPTALYGVFTIDLTGTSQPLDPGDDDGDGLNNSWEKSHGADKNNPDSDGDGVSDGDEHRAGTGLLDDRSYLAMIRVMPAAATHLRVEWDSVAGKSYQLQHAPTQLQGDALAFSNVNAVVTATGAASHTIVTNGASLPMGVFRVRLVE